MMPIVRTFSSAAAAVLVSGATALAADCAAPASWSDHAAVPPPQNDTAPDSNCAFHVWAWNTFLWMTQDVDNAPRFTTFYSIDALKALPDKSVLAAETLVLRPRSGKARSGPEVEGIDSILQAGSRGVLVNATPPGASSGRVTYFSQAVNDTFYDFVAKNGFYDQQTYLAADPTTNFPNGAMEFKFSWKVVAEGEDTSTFFTTPAKISKLVTDPASGNIVASLTETLDATVALVGIHVVGVVQDHPEFIWATFEHVNNAPDLPAGMGTGSTDPVSDKNYTFYAAGTPANRSNVSNSGRVAFAGDPSDQLVTPVVDVYRQFAWGSDTSADGKANATNVQSMNASVAAKTLSGDTIWQNYQLIGSVWGPPNTLVPNQQVTGVGSTMLSNATLETFTQTTQNCFSCHNTFPMEPGQPGMNMNVSHVFSELFRK